MDQGNENENAVFADLNFKINCAERALNWVRSQILREKSFTAEEASKLGFLYAFYSMQHFTHSSDLYGLRQELSPHPLNEEDFGVDKEAALKWQAAVVAAQSGDHTILKTELDEELLEDDQELKSKLDEIVAAMPDRGPKFSLPLPAWMDPEFSIEGASQE